MKDKVLLKGGSGNLQQCKLAPRHFVDETPHINFYFTIQLS